jgi:hypothetical protein
MIEGRMAPQDYQYDVFFSYKRHSLTLEWTREVHKRLQFWPDAGNRRQTSQPVR